MSFSRKKDKIAGKFRPEEINAIRTVLTEVTQLCEEDARTDPVFARLFPDIYRDDPIEAAELRQYTEVDLKKSKIEAIAIVFDTLGEKITLTPDQGDAWLRALNDARLALGVRLEMTDDFDLEAEYRESEDSLDENRAIQISLYGYLTYLQDSLIESLG